MIVVGELKILSGILLLVLGCSLTRGEENEMKSMYENEADYYATAVFDETVDPQQVGAGRSGSATHTHTCNTIRSVPGDLRYAQNMRPRGLGYFYQKYTEAYGIPVLGSSRLSDDALRRACYVVRFIFADRYDVRNSYYKKYGRIALMATSEVTTNIPEHASLGAWWNTRARGLGATTDRPVSTAGEENALCLNSDAYRQEDILLHEFSHGAHLLGAVFVIPGFDSRLRTLYNSARARGLWANTYSLSTDREYLAEGVQSYFNVNAYSNPPNGIHNHVNTRERLRSYDPQLYSLIEELFPCRRAYINRCNKDRNAELNQYLGTNCDGEDGGEESEEGGEESEEGGEEGGEGSEEGGEEGGEGSEEGGEEGGEGSEEGGEEGGEGSEEGGEEGGEESEEGGEGSEEGTGECTDDHPSCAYWAGRGECRINPGYMTVNCRLSCGECGGEGGGCEDDNPSCEYWAGIGECRRNPGYMLRSCKKSCNSC